MNKSKALGHSSSNGNSVRHLLLSEYGDWTTEEIHIREVGKPSRSLARRNLRQSLLKTPKMIKATRKYKQMLCREESKF